MVARLTNLADLTGAMVYEKLKPLVADRCPFANLPETGRARWGEILDSEKMKKCVWVRPKLLAMFVSWLNRTEVLAPSLNECLLQFVQKHCLIDF